MYIITNRVWYCFSGEYGVVYRARLTARGSKDKLDSIVAVKTLRGCELLSFYN